MHENAIRHGGIKSKVEFTMKIIYLGEEKLNIVG